MKEQGTLVAAVQESLVELVGDSKAAEEAFGVAVYCRFALVSGVPEAEAEVEAGVLAAAVVGVGSEAGVGRLLEVGHDLRRFFVEEQGLEGMFGAGVEVEAEAVGGMFGVDGAVVVGVVAGVGAEVGAEAVVGRLEVEEV